MVKKEKVRKGAGNHNGTPNFMRDGKLTDYGRQHIRDLARKGMKTDAIASRVPASVPRGTITACIANAFR